MKKSLLVLAAVAMAGSAFAQGTIKLENNNTIKTDGSGTYKVPIWVDLNKDGVRQHVAGSTTDEIGIGQWAALNGFSTATMGLFTAGSLTPFATAVFRVDANGDFLGTPSTQTVNVPGTNPGDTPTLTAKAWVGSLGFDASPVQGSWTWTVSRQLGGTPAGGGTPILPSGLAGLGNEVTSAGLGAVQIVPEPSTIALGAIGIGALLLRRRK